MTASDSATRVGEIVVFGPLGACVLCLSGVLLPYD
jgi:hypothetical protein